MRTCGAICLDHDGRAQTASRAIVAIRGERGSYNELVAVALGDDIVAIRGERGSYN